MAVSQSAQKSSSKSKYKAPAPSVRRSGPSAQERLVLSLIELMQQGVAPWRKPWDGSGGGHHCNLISGHRYRGSNPILLTLAMHIRGSALPFWCGYAEARQLGISPKKGSKAAMILRPQLHQQVNQPEAGQREQADGPEGAARSWVSYQPVAVFNAADLEGPGLTELITARQEAAGLQARPEPERLAAAEAVLSAWPVPVSFGGDRAFYLPQLDRIQLPERASFQSAAAFYATWAHEQVHSTGHVSRLKRDLGGAFGKPRYAREELVAELGAVLLGDRLEIGSQLQSHAAYLEHWIALLQAEPQVLFQVLGEARQAVELIAPEGVSAREMDCQAEVQGASRAMGWRLRVVGQSITSSSSIYLANTVYYQAHH
ncbi:MAG: zincin-like metallopeptidase domain-containing protein [Cyanobacteria bacterium]|nr:zincin-like metallopeptidase domain-containing protein [Cyanobacteriota bacterium]